MFEHDKSLPAQEAVSSVVESPVQSSTPASSVFDALLVPGQKAAETQSSSQSLDTVRERTISDIQEKIDAMQGDLDAIDRAHWSTKLFGSNRAQLEKNMQSLTDVVERLEQGQHVDGSELTADRLSKIRDALDLEHLTIAAPVEMYEASLREKGFSEELIQDLSPIQKEVLCTERQYHRMHLSESELVDMFIEQHNLPAILGGTIKVDRMKSLREEKKGPDGFLTEEGLRELQALDQTPPDQFIDMQEVRGRIEGWIAHVKGLPVEVTLQDKVVNGTSVLEILQEEGVYRNGFVAREASNGKAGEQTKRMFENDMYEPLSRGVDEDRPVYAALNPSERPEGCAAYGDITLQFAPAVKERSFMVSEDSADARLEAHHVMEADKAAELLHRYADGYGLSMIKSLLSFPGSDPLKAGFYPEVHVFGPLRLDRDLLSIRAPEATLERAQEGHPASKATVERLEGLSQKFGVPLEWY